MSALYESTLFKTINHSNQTNNMASKRKTTNADRGTAVCRESPQIDMPDMQQQLLTWTTHTYTNTYTYKLHCFYLLPLTAIKAHKSVCRYVSEGWRRLNAQIYKAFKLKNGPDGRCGWRLVYCSWQQEINYLKARKYVLLPPIVMPAKATTTKVQHMQSRNKISKQKKKLTKTAGMRLQNLQSHIKPKLKKINGNFK